MPEEEQVECATCQDTGYVCEECNAADGNCSCEGGPEIVPCPDCGGSDR